MTDIKFAAIGINHAHIYGQVDCLKDAGAQFVAFYAIEDDLAAAFGAKYPEAKRVADPRAILEDASVAVVLTSAIPADRAAISISAMQHGKDVLTDKPGMTTFAQLDEIKRVQKETGRI
jgi:predicted dehydrogenase